MFDFQLDNDDMAAIADLETGVRTGGDPDIFGPRQSRRKRASTGDRLSGDQATESCHGGRSSDNSR